MWECPCVNCVSPILLVLLLAWIPTISFLRVCLPFNLDTGCCGVQSLHWMLTRPFLLLHGCHSLSGTGSTPCVIGVEALMFSFDQSTLPSHACPRPAVIAEASESHPYMVTANLFTACVDIHRSGHKQPKVMFLSSVMFIPDLTIGYGVEWAGMWARVLAAGA